MIRDLGYVLFHNNRIKFFSEPRMGCWFYRLKKTETGAGEMTQRLRALAGIPHELIFFKHKGKLVSIKCRNQATFQLDD